MLEAGERRDDLEIVLSRLAVIVGRVVDEYGEPIENAFVTAKGADLEVGRTNDIGEFRIPRVQPGHYVVSATAPIADSSIATGPGQAASAAVPIEITSSGEASVGELPIVSVANPRQVRGRVLDPRGSLTAGATVLLLQEESGTRASISAARGATTTNSAGEFGFTQIDDGRYRVKATRDAQTGFADIVVAGNDLDGVTVRLQTATELSGEVRTEGFECRNALVRALSLDGTGDDDRIALEAPVTKGRFSLPPLTGKQQLEVRCAEGQAAQIDGIALEGRRISGSILDTTKLAERTQITVYARPLTNRVFGTVLDSSNRPGDGLVVLVADDTSHWRPPFQYVWVARVTSGAFSLSGIPPGRYHLMHEPPRRMSEIESPQYLQQVIARRAKPIDVQETTSFTVSLRMK